MKPEDLKKILDSHTAWLRGEKGGIRANLRSADLSYADLRSADLSYADLRSADLRSADLSYADLRSADLRSANLRSANLSYADLRSANLSYADLRSANLRSADLSYADLRSADLSYAKNSDLVQAQTLITPEGDLIGWKKCDNAVTVKLRIPANAKRSNAAGRKCRAEFAEVVEVIGAKEGISVFPDKPHIVYRVGEIVRPDAWDDNRWNECSSGIHFFITRAEAEAY